MWTNKSIKNANVPLPASGMVIVRAARNIIIKKGKKQTVEKVATQRNKRKNELARVS